MLEGKKHGSGDVKNSDTFIVSIPTTYSPSQ